MSIATTGHEIFGDFPFADVDLVPPGPPICIHNCAEIVDVIVQHLLYSRGQISMPMCMLVDQFVQEHGPVGSGNAKGTLSTDEFCNLRPPISLANRQVRRFIQEYKALQNGLAGLFRSRNRGLVDSIVLMLGSNQMTPKDIYLIDVRPEFVANRRPPESADGDHVTDGLASAVSIGCLVGPMSNQRLRSLTREIFRRKFTDSFSAIGRTKLWMFARMNKSAVLDEQLFVSRLNFSPSLKKGVNRGRIFIGNTLRKRVNKSGITNQNTCEISFRESAKTNSSCENLKQGRENFPPNLHDIGKEPDSSSKEFAGDIEHCDHLKIDSAEIFDQLPEIFGEAGDLVWFQYHKPLDCASFEW